MVIQDEATIIQPDNDKAMSASLSQIRTPSPDIENTGYLHNLLFCKLALFKGLKTNSQLKTSAMVIY